MIYNLSKHNQMFDPMMKTALLIPSDTNHYNSGDSFLNFTTTNCESSSYVHGVITHKDLSSHTTIFFLLFFYYMRGLLLPSYMFVYSHLSHIINYSQTIIIPFEELRFSNMNQIFSMVIHMTQSKSVFMYPTLLKCLIIFYFHSNIHSYMSIYLKLLS